MSRLSVSAITWYLPHLCLVVLNGRLFLSTLYIYYRSFMSILWPSYACHTAHRNWICLSILCNTLVIVSGAHLPQYLHRDSIHENYLPVENWIASMLQLWGRKFIFWYYKYALSLLLFLITIIANKYITPVPPW